MPTVGLASCKLSVEGTFGVFSLLLFFGTGLDEAEKQPSCKERTLGWWHSSHPQGTGGKTQILILVMGPYQPL